jgi:DNA (cytosine-5)-methyltransferase 1
VGKLGPLPLVTSWQIKGFGGENRHSSDTSILVETKNAKYLLSKPNAAYRSLYKPLKDSSNVCLEVYKTLAPSQGATGSGGSKEEKSSLLFTSYADVVRNVAKAKLTCVGDGGRAMLAVNLSGHLICSQLRKMEPFKDQSKQDFESLPFFRELYSHMRGSQLHGIHQNTRTHGKTARSGAAVKILDAADNKEALGEWEQLPDEKPENAQMDLDMALAQRMQAEEEMSYRNQGRKKERKDQEGYLRMDLVEYADDYPEPSVFKQSSEGLDELLLADPALIGADPEFLPHYTLSDFTVYNYDQLLTPLELLPQQNCETDVEIFVSGTMGALSDAEEDIENPVGGISVSESGGSGSGSGSGSTQHNPTDVRILSSDIKELKVQFFLDSFIFILVRTSAAWYKLMQPAPEYAKHWEVLVKVAKVGVHVLETLNNPASVLEKKKKDTGNVRRQEYRVSAVSFKHIVQSCREKGLLKGKDETIERFLVVHGQTILSLIKSEGKKEVQNCALVSQIKQRMALCKHSKLYRSNKKYLMKKNPMLNFKSSYQRAKPMRATTTKSVYTIWESHFKAMEEAEALKQKEEEKETESPEAALFNSDEPEVQEKDLEELGAAFLMGLAEEKEEKFWWSDGHDSNKDFSFSKWYGKAKTVGKLKMYEEAVFAGQNLGLNDGVILHLSEEECEANNVPGDRALVSGIVQALWEDSEGNSFIRIWQLVHGNETVLGSVASKFELFLVPKCIEASLESVDGKVNVNDQHTGFTIKGTTKAILNDNLEEHFYRRTWESERGLFGDLPDLQFGKADNPEKEEAVTCVDSDCIIVEDIRYQPNDFVYINAQQEFDSNDGEEEMKKKRPSWKGSSNYGLHSYHICQIISYTKKGVVTVRRFYRPEDLPEEVCGKDFAYECPVWEVFYSEDVSKVSLDNIEGKCTVCNASQSEFIPHVFMCKSTWDSQALELTKDSCEADFEEKDTFYEEAIKQQVEKEEQQSEKLAAMDMFAGCGGLSEGMHQAGAVETKWAIEFDKEAAAAFQMNNPNAKVYALNINSLLLNCMKKAGLEDYLSPSVDEDARNQASELKADDFESLPRPGEVDFICGGPPCQGYSGMNRFNKGTWSRVQNEMVLGFLSYADVYRPKYFMLENVRNFVVHNKGQTFKLVVKTLLELGYQVRFGVLNAGNYGVSQSRKRLFIWGAAPGLKLPEWPSASHVFSCPHLNIPYPDGGKYFVHKRMKAGAPLRSVTVQDTIGDLPEIENGAFAPVLDYPGKPVSSFQAFIRGSSQKIHDHISKEMNELNLHRCTLIPKNNPSADWRVLQAIVAEQPEMEKFKDSKGQEYALVPYCLPNTAKKHNNWRGLYGRLDAKGHFPTAITDPNPMGKVGTVFHPNQDRIVSVRECARCQGFPDAFEFSGTIHNRHRQVGNAVPPPLAKALGVQLRAAYNTSKQSKKARKLKE